MPEGVGAGIYRGTINPEPSDQTDLKERRRCNLQDGREPTFEGEDGMWAQGPADL